MVARILPWKVKAQNRTQTFIHVGRFKPATPIFKAAIRDRNLHDWHYMTVTIPWIQHHYRPAFWNRRVLTLWLLQVVTSAHARYVGPEQIIVHRLTLSLFNDFHSTAEVLWDGMRWEGNNACWIGKDLEEAVVTYFKTLSAFAGDTEKKTGILGQNSL